MLTHERLKELFTYDPETGVFTRRISRGPFQKGSVAGTEGRFASGIRCVIWLGGKPYYRSRLAWFYMTGVWAEEVDHRDRDTLNDRWNNLREATRSQNQANTKTYRNNKTGQRGVHYRPEIGRFRAVISENGRNRSLGHFDTLEEAAAAWRSAAVNAHGEFARIA